jgi:hypothetical protein
MVKGPSDSPAGTQRDRRVDQRARLRNLRANLILAQRYWRQANAATRHVGLNGMVGYEVLGKDFLG